MKVRNYVLIPEGKGFTFLNILKHRDFGGPQILVKNGGEINAGFATDVLLNLRTGNGLMVKSAVQTS